MLLIYYNILTMEDRSTAFLTLNDPSDQSVKLLKDLKWIICIDTSGSTTNLLDTNTILDCERNFVRSFKNQLKNKIAYVEWNSVANTFQLYNMNALKSTGGTDPECMFKNDDIKKIITQSDAMLLLTDGQISQHEIKTFGERMLDSGCHLKAIIGVLVGKRHDVINDLLPANIDVSVLVPAMWSNSCILYYDSVKTYIMCSNGVFRTKLGLVDINNETKWSDLKTMDDGLMNMVVNDYSAIRMAELSTNGYIPFGENVFFNPNNLLGSFPSWTELQSYPFDRICQYFKVNFARS
jgi:hypothetical protein